MDIEKVGRIIVNSAIKVHKALGPGLLESAYQKCLAHELSKNMLDVKCEVPLPLQYEDINICRDVAKVEDDTDPRRKG